MSPDHLLSPSETHGPLDPERESAADNLCFLLRRSNLPLISTLDSMAASHVPEGRSRTESGQVIFTLEEPKEAGRTFRHEQVCDEAEWSRNLENVRKIDTPQRFEHPTGSSFIGTRYTLRKDARPKMNYFYEILWQPGEGWTKSKDSPFSLAWFPVPDSLLVMISGLDSCFIPHSANTNTVRQGCAADRAFSPTAALCLILRS